MTEAAIIVSGLPASGKSTVAQQLAGALGWPLLDKDDFLEQLFVQHPVSSLEDRRRLSRRSDDLFQQAALAASKAVVVSHWRPARGPEGTGTPTAAFARNFAKIIEVHCNCPVEIALQRFTSRKRHASHMDTQRSREEIHQQFVALAPGYPLGLGTLVSVNTGDALDLDILVTRVLAELAE